jgi:hypothetical protein
VADFEGWESGGGGEEVSEVGGMAGDGGATGGGAEGIPWDIDGVILVFLRLVGVAVLDSARRRTVGHV